MHTHTHAHTNSCAVFGVCNDILGGTRTNVTVLHWTTDTCTHTHAHIHTQQVNSCWTWGVLNISGGTHILSPASLPCQCIGRCYSGKKKKHTHDLLMQQRKILGEEWWKGTTRTFANYEVRNCKWWIVCVALVHSLRVCSEVFDEVIQVSKFLQ